MLIGTVNTFLYKLCSLYWKDGSQLSGNNGQLYWDAYRKDQCDLGWPMPSFHVKVLHDNGHTGNVAQQ